MNLVKFTLAVVKVIRPIHWVKNLSLFAALVFAGGLFNPALFINAFWAFIAFSLAASATYVFNDIMDAKVDRHHPVKKNRPIASNDLPVSLALILALSLAGVALFWSSLLGTPFFLLVGSYLLIQLVYSLGLKNIAIIDILIIATGFIIRVYAGAFVIDAHLSVWFLLCVISVALFLAAGKRRAELNVLKKVGVTRKSLTKYSRELLDSYVTMFGNAAWMSWALYTFYESPRATQDVWIFLAEFSRTTTIDKLLMTTIPVVIFAIMRYQSLIFEGKSEAPESLFLKDRALVVSLIIWVSLVVWLLYGGVSVR